VDALPCTHRRIRTAPPAALAALVLLTAGCDGSGDAAEAGETTSAAPSAASASELQGTWQTPAIPLERVRANFLAAGGTPEQADEFLSSIDGENTVSFVIQVGDDTWVELESDDGRTAVTGWRGEYTTDADGVHAHEVGTSCVIDYATTIDDEGRLTIEVLKDEGSDPGCGAVDMLAQKTIYESAPFSPVP
jgi:hypothetical protein